VSWLDGRSVFELTRVLAAPMLMAFGARSEAQSQAAPSLPATPSCGDSRATQAQTEGPYFKPRSPERASLIEPGVTGTKLVLAGVVRTAACRPVAHALLDFWQADGRGQYDNAGFHLRGHQYADDQGRYRLETVMPGEYPGRTPHIHVKVATAGGGLLTSQFYIAGEPGNERDGIFRAAARDPRQRERIEMRLAPAPGLETGALATTIDIVVG